MKKLVKFMTSPFVKKKKKIKLYIWIPVNSISKVSNGCIRDLGFNPRLHQKLIDIFA